MNDNKKTTSAKTSNKTMSSSLRYPKNNFETCLEKIQLLFIKNSKNFMSTEAMVLDMGFLSRSGTTDSILASLKYYGLLEKKENNRHKVVDYIIDYCIAGKIDKDAIKRSLLSVPINKKIFAAYDIDNIPSENEIKSFLIKDCGYSIKEATTYIEIFNKNMLFYKSCTMQIDDITKTKKINEKMDLFKSEVSLHSIKEITVYNHPLSNGKSITINLPANIKDLSTDDLEEANDLLTLVLNKIKKQLEGKI